MAHKSPVFKALLGKRNKVQLDKKSKSRNRNNKFAKREKAKQIEGE